MKRVTEILSNDANESLAFEGLSASDRIFIRTRNSEYQFVVLDPVRRRGLISGGLLGRRPRQAVLVGTLRQDGGACAGDPTGLRVQSQALFYVQARVGVERFVTSTINELAHARTDNTTRPAA